MEINKEHLGVKKITENLLKDAKLLLMCLVFFITIELFEHSTFNLFIFAFFFATIIFKSIQNIKSAIVDEFNIVVKKEKDLLSYKLSVTLSQNVDHQLKTPLLALQQGFKQNYTIIKVLSDYAREDGKRDFDRIVYGCNDKTKECSNCHLHGTDYCNKERRLIEDINKNQNTISSAIKNMYKTLELLKANKKRKTIINDFDLYELIESSFNIYTMLNKYNFEYFIDKNIKNIKIKNISNEELFNVINNHVQNSLEAHSTIIEIKANIKEDWLYLFIVDNGQGIPESVSLSKIWEIGESTKIGENRGFGMFLCKEIIEHAGGNIKVVSTNKKGTTIVIKLPSLKQGELNGKQ